MLLGSQQYPNNSNGLSDKNDEWIVLLLSNGQYVEAYRLLKSEPQQKLSTIFNLALCSYFAEEYEQTLSRLDEALAKLQPNPVDNTFVNDDLYKKLESIQNADDSYLQGMTEMYIRHFPYIVKNSILRIKIDCYLALSLWNRIIELAPLLKSYEYQNVEEAVAEAFLHIK